MGGVQVVGDIDLPLLDHRHARAGVHHTLEDEALDVGRFAPVLLIGLHDQPDSRRMADKLIRPQPDRMFPEAIVPHLLEVFLRDDPPRRRGHGAVKGHEVGPGLVQVEAHPVGIDDLHLPHPLVEDLRLVAGEAEFHILGGEGVAVVEPQPLA
jgi:hypothetical protein